MDKKEIDPRNVQKAIERMRADNPKGTVSIQADKEADLKFVVDVANAARKAGITDISVSTEKN
jgi:biopolymer transport protein ExbD